MNGSIRQRLQRMQDKTIELGKVHGPKRSTGAAAANGLITGLIVWLALGLLICTGLLVWATGFVWTHAIGAWS